MTASRIVTILVALLTIAQTGQAQMLQPASAEQPVSVYSSLASQTSSPNNYALLQPIGNQPDMAVPSTPASTKLMQSGLLQPIEPIQRAQSRGDATADSTSDSIKVTPVSFKRGQFDRHEFKVENIGSTTLRGAKVLLKAPAGSLVQQVIPKPDSVDGSNVIMSVEDLAPGAHTSVEIMIENPSDAFARFDSIVLTGNGSPVTKSSTGSTIAHQIGHQRDEGIVKLLQPRASTMLKPQIRAQQASATRPVQEKKVVQTTSSTTPLAENVEPLAVESIPKPSYRSEIYSAKRTSTATDQKNNSAVNAWLVGPDRVNSGEEAEYSIEVQNKSTKTAGGIIVQLSIPESMKVTVLDRDAWYDSKTRKISWELSSLDKDAPETIRYKAILNTPGAVQQSIVVGMNQTVQCTASLQTTATKK